MLLSAAGFVVRCDLGALRGGRGVGKLPSTAGRCSKKAQVLAG